ncbi:hypothetical protein RF11_02663 [Thelohanellus kitauei]|uniref:C2 domain-containing protein n=1 Tax=Thelohanellus kitauei TaxID=669202 RepID=A0A0C2MJ18_THEKT|nr:hypothetical protein RF11_02663 [Thelohanellus kitauei]
MSSENLHLRFIDCNELKIDGYDPTSSILIKIVLVFKQKKYIQKTSLYPINRYIFMNENFIFNLPLCEYHEACVEFQVCASLGSFSADVFAYVSVRPQSSGVTRRPYLEALNSLGKWIITKIWLDSAIYKPIT